MPRIYCPGNPDCFIDCPGGGFADFIEPYGPCNTGCDSGSFGHSLLQLEDNELAECLSSGVMVNYPVEHIALFARRLRRRDLLLDQSLLELLSRLPSLASRSRLSAEWKRSSINNMIRTLAVASGIAPLA